MSARFLLLGTSLLLCACATAQENPNYQHSTKYGQGQTQVADNVYPQSQTNVGATQVNSPAIHTPGAQTHAATSQTGITHTHAMASGHSTTPAHAIDTDHGNAGYVGNEGVMIRADHPATQAASPTERAYNSDQMQGTPGYEMMRAQNETVQPQTQTHPSYPAPRAPVYEAAPAPTYTPYAPQAAPTPTAPRQVEYDYGENLRGDDNTQMQPMVPAYQSTNDQSRTGTAANIGTGLSYIVREGDTIYSLSRRLCAPMGDITAANGIGGDYAIAIGQTLYLPTSRC